MRVVWAAVVVALAFAGRSSALGEKKVKADIRGLTKNVMAAGEPARKKGLLGTIRVEGKKEKGTQYDKAVISITTDTKIYKLDGKKRKPAKFEDLKKGLLVQALFTGPVAESYPVQAKAREVVILPE
jgi:hypothetical protein